MRLGAPRINPGVFITVHSKGRKLCLGLYERLDLAEEAEISRPVRTLMTRGQPTFVSNHIHVSGMSHLTPFTSFLQSTKKIVQGAIYQQSSHTASIHILDDYSLLNIFYLYRPVIFEGHEDGFSHISGGKGWDRERWWYKLAHVCQRWRSLLLGSASHLGLCLLCTYGTPVADMLVLSPSLPLVIDYFHADRDITTEDEEGIIFALLQRDRVRRVRLRMSVPNLQKLIMAIDEDYPVLEYLVIVPSPEDKSTILVLPETSFQAPHLRHLALMGFGLPVGSRLLTTAVGLVTLALSVGHPSAYFQPNVLLHWLSFMPQLETLVIAILFPVPNHDVERQLIHTPTMTHITLPNLRAFVFRGVSAYMEAIVRRITTPRLEKLGIQFFKQLSFFIPHLVRFMSTTDNLRFGSAKFKFSRDEVYVEVYPREEAETYALSIYIDCWHLDWQVSSVAQIFNPLRQIFSTVEHLTLEHKVHSQSSEEHNEVDRTEWHKLLRSFNNVKTLHVGDGLGKELSRILRLDDGELPLELLPELQELTYSESGGTGDAFTSFIDTRQNAGRPVTLAYTGPRSVTPLSRSSSSSFSESSNVMTGSSEAGSDPDT